ncbi:3(2)-bisphosphate nucleotidase [Cyclospora cayetanensis]|uniref:3'(2'),5'-bisphosphate nucleotidase 1 n=1 Tax=Cyclospora cayetanensis TaxID=88456 RepID=A0A1D3D843_9EIME|nr:3(2)-bisphosphate nucleotidase [Cyclospora cayetanensis]
MPSATLTGASGPLLCADLPPLEVGKGRKVHIQDLVALCRSAAVAILDVYTRPEEEWELEHKEGHEPLTKADLDANAILTDGLRRLCPDCLLVSEESTLASYEDRQAAEFVWLVDPLDGTKEFLKRSGEFTINLGLCRYGDPVFGIVAVPVEDRIYLGGVVVGGAWEMEGSNQTLTPMRCSTFKWADKGLRVTASSSHNSPGTRAFAARLNEPKLIRAGSSLKFVRLARGDAEVYPRFALCSEWDTCAPHALLRAAGGEIWRWSDAANGGPQGPLEYNKPSLLSPFFVAVARLQDGEDTAPPAAPSSYQKTIAEANGC